MGYREHNVLSLDLRIQFIIIFTYDSELHSAWEIMIKYELDHSTPKSG